MFFTRKTFQVFNKKNVHAFHYFKPHVRPSNSNSFKKNINQSVKNSMKNLECIVCTIGAINITHLHYTAIKFAYTIEFKTLRGESFFGISSSFFHTIPNFFFDWIRFIKIRSEQITLPNKFVYFSLLNQIHLTSYSI